MDLKITGTVKQILPEQSGESRNGPWRKQDFILETPGDYPKQVCITQWGDNIESFGVQEGETLTVHIDIQSREYKGRWYTDVKGWRVEREAAQGGPPPGHLDGPFPEPPADGGVDDDLPF
jgi:hypothetical protein